ncbi:MAG: pyrroline-5-carboxylate reductase [Acidimicrobiia bacterium]
MNIVIIGGGNMGRSFVSGLKASNFDSIFVVEKNEENKKASEELQVKAFTTLEELSKKIELSNEDIFLIAVKPKDVKEVVEQAFTIFPQTKTFISIAAGLAIESIKSVSNEITVIRAMPNLGASQKQSATAVCFTGDASSDIRTKSIQILESVGKVFEVDEKQMNLITAVSGSGPAYYFLLSEELEKFAIKNGLDENIARSLVAQTLKSADAVSNEDVSFSSLREQVTSPGGTTQAALTSFQEANFTEIVESALKAATIRAEQLNNQ